jgi:hypothetical protein
VSKSCSPCEIYPLDLIQDCSSSEDNFNLKSFSSCAILAFSISLVAAISFSFS